jgi:hypothetical protein
MTTNIPVVSSNRWHFGLGHLQRPDSLLLKIIATCGKNNTLVFFIKLNKYIIFYYKLHN